MGNRLKSLLVSLREKTGNLQGREEQPAVRYLMHVAYAVEYTVWTDAREEPDQNRRYASNHE
jgi:hypothetical protein